jgi:putative ABC transport system ATP-binding protein
MNVLPVTPLPVSGESPNFPNPIVNSLGEALIEMKGIVKVFKTPAGDFPALKGINAVFFRGEFVSVVGKSGSGKSTLVNMITGIDRPTSGSVLINGTCIQEMSESQMAAWRGRNLGIVFQFFQLLPMLSLLENVMLPMDFCNVYDSAEREEHAMELLRLVRLDDYAHKLPAAISGGQQQSAAIARALANDPPIIVADEPTGNLDSRTSDSVFQIFADLMGRGKTILMVTHDSNLAERTSRILLIADGLLVHDGKNHNGLVNSSVNPNENASLRTFSDTAGQEDP